MNDPQPDRKTDPEAWQAWLNRQTEQHDEEHGRGHTRHWTGTEDDDDE